ncbi:tRNA (adenosine(37)-N6)-dimethylallyltransferase MiaA [Parerythrobacter aurantius]|uniref:tRNA (adenosine(37)-N6)-dimethylallyltransferase MiaA n=1 Tax=Parerythrobacter aurantius TaxID=3127706 RepID=UPI003248C223
MSTQLSPESGNDLPPLALIAGPTASGKSDVAVRLALALREQGREAVVINADSAQVYADLRVLSARPSEDDMHGVPHRLFGEWDGAQACSGADWAGQAKQEIEAAQTAGIVPILVGGTGLYIRTLLDGIAPIPPIDPYIRQAVRALSQAEARSALEMEDAAAAARLAPADAARTARALEVVRSTGCTLDRWQERKEGGIGDRVQLFPLVLLPDRDWLYARCDRRYAMMLELGAVGEVEALLARGLDPALPVMRAIGVAEIAPMLKGELDRAQCIAAGQQATRNYAKRQYTWFRHQPPEGWPRISSIDFNLEEVFEGLFQN